MNLKILIYLLLGLILVLILLMLILCRRFIKPNGLMHIDEYTNKDAYRMLYFTPLGDLKKHRHLVLNVEVQKWAEESHDAYEEDNY